MSQVRQIDVPPDSLLAQFGDETSYRDCFARNVPGIVTLPQLIERFYGSVVFAPERAVLGLLGKPVSSAAAENLASGTAECFGVWKVVGRRQDQILLESKGTGTASWLSVQRGKDETRLLFGSWVGNIGQSGWRALLKAHLWYSRALLGGV